MIQLPSLSEWIAILGGVYGAWGYPVIFLAATIENTFVLTWIVPGGTMVLLGGIYANLGELQLPWVILVGFAGTFSGASIDYALGRWGQHLLRPILEQPDTKAGLDRVGWLLDRYGMLALFAGHFVGPLRSLVALSAGLARMPYSRFALFEAPAAFAWAAAYGIGGYFLADQIPLLESVLERFGWALAAFAAAFFVWKLYLRPRWRASTDAPPPAAPGQ